MLNRLMFIYFIQKKGFLDGDPDYLRNRLQAVAGARARTSSSLLPLLPLRLFHEGFGKPRDGPQRSSNELLGEVPYLNGGLFDVHQLEERQRRTSRFPTRPSSSSSTSSTQYQWHLDERPLRDDNEINPDVLGYIFEKYINQKQMGAYYTKEDITDYISQNTIIPFLFDAAEKKCAIAFEPGRGRLAAAARTIPTATSTAGRSHRASIIAAARRRSPPASTDVGQARRLEPAGRRREYALPTETWREYVARRKRCLEAARKAQAAARSTHINDLITLNLDIRQFAEDVIENCEGPELLRAFCHAIEKVTVLDPTCGSGAFLFAALNILEPLYEACLDRMQAFVDDLERSGEQAPARRSSRISARCWTKSARHPNRDYFILKSIIVNNLYGVDIMEEAVEICKLRLFLKLVAQVDNGRAARTAARHRLQHPRRQHAGRLRHARRGQEIDEG